MMIVMRIGMMVAKVAMNHFRVRVFHQRKKRGQMGAKEIKEKSKRIFKRREESQMRTHSTIMMTTKKTINNNNNNNSSNSQI
jgi:hypothetical protein